MNGKITVTITGDVRVGKTTLAAVIEAALQPIGCKVSMVDDASRAARALKLEHARKILRNRKVTIQTATYLSDPKIHLHGSDCYVRNGMGSCNCKLSK